MEIKEDIIIVGAGIAGLTTALGLHRLGLRSLVLESSDSLRVAGFTLTLWTNAWKALDAVGIGASLRHHFLQIRGYRIASADCGHPSSEVSFETNGKYPDYESRCVKRKDLLETLEKSLPRGTIRYSSKVVSIQESGLFKLLHLADGSVLKTKVLIGCDGVNSVVAQWLGFQKPVDAGRSEIRGLTEFPDGHGFEPQLHLYIGHGVRVGFLPSDEKSLYWFCNFPSSIQNDKDMAENPIKMKQFVLSKIGNIPKEAFGSVERTELDCISCAALKFRLPWNVLLGDIARSNVCVAGDALHPMTPDLAQGGCSALEDSVTLARCLAEALLTKARGEMRNDEEEEEEYLRIKKGLDKYAKARRWRSCSLIINAYVVGLIQSDGKVMTFLREKFLSGYTVGTLMRMADFDCGKLAIS